MKKLFLTSGVVLCMACPAFATDTIDIDENGQVNNSAAMCVENVLGVDDGETSFEAKWAAVNYAIAYAKGTAGNHDASYVSGTAPENTPITYDSTNTALAANTFTAQGYHFGGWEAPANLETGAAPVSPATYILYQGTQASSPNGDYTGGTLATYGYTPASGTTVTLTAHWVPNTYTVSYAAGQHGSGSSSDSATYDATYTPKAVDAAGITPATGYTFSGWTGNYSSTGTQTDTAYTAGTGFTYQITGPLTLTAQYTANQYSVIYNKGAHNANTDSNYTGWTHTNGATYNSEYTLPTSEAGYIAASTAATGYTFRGWSTSAEPTVTKNGNSYDVSNAWTGEQNWTHTDAFPVYAAYSANEYTVSYSCGTAAAGTGAISGDAPASQTATYDDTFVFAGNVGNTTLHDPATPCARVGYQFNGWSCKTNTNNTAVDQTTNATQWKVADDVTCTATWTNNTINITWDPKNGTPSTQNQCTYDGAVTIPEKPSKTGYTFGGWNVNNSNNNQ